MMKPFRIACLTGALVAASLGTGVAQEPAPVPPPAAPPSVEPSDNGSSSRGVVRVGQDYTLGAGERVREVVVITGNATIEGHVDRDVVVVLGTATVAATAVIEQSLVVVGGYATIARGASVGRDLVVVGGALDAPGDFMPGGEHVVIGSAQVGGRLASMFPWFTRGVLWGRRIVPDLPWIWGVIAVFFVVYLAVNVVLDPPVRGSAATLMEKPLTSFGAGLLVLLLTGPVCMILAVSVVGLAVIPIALCALLVASIVGKVGVMRWVGMRVLGDADVSTPLRATGAFAIGFALVTLVYMVPVLGFASWALVGALGTGAATLAFADSYRREQPPRAGISIPAAVPPVPPPPQHAAALESGAPTAGTDAAPVAPPLPLSDLVTMPRATFRDRLAASVLDLILVAVVVRLANAWDLDRSVLLAFLIYNIAFWAWKQTTVGGIICQLRIVRVNGQPFTFADALVRGLSSVFSLVVVGLGYFWILKDPEQQSWHDKIAGTYVVTVPRHYPL